MKNNDRREKGENKFINKFILEILGIQKDYNIVRKPKSSLLLFYFQYSVTYQQNHCTAEHY